MLRGGGLNIQIRLRYRRAAFEAAKPDAAAIEGIVKSWIGGAGLPVGVLSLTATDWDAPGLDSEAVRRRLKRRGKHYTGVPGIVKEYAAASVTLCDYDSVNAPSLPAMMETARVLRLKPKWARYDRTARGWHVIIRWNRDLTPGETVALQLLLGSDPKRERFNLGRILAGGGANSRWNLLFSRKL